MADHHFAPDPASNGNGNVPLPDVVAAPPSSPWQKTWLILRVIQARLRFIAILVGIGLLILYWPTLKARYDKWTRPGATATQEPGSDVEYFCPMHPQIIRDNDREKCPLCFMPLSKRRKGAATEEALPPGVINRVQLSPYRVTLAGVQTTEVAYLRLTKPIETVGFVEFDERKETHIAARVKGRIDKLFVNFTGEMVHPGDELALLYSPDLVVTVQNLLDARRSDNPDLERLSRQRLRLWDIDGPQIDEILRTGNAPSHLTIRSPMLGHVIRKYQVEGKYVEEGAPLYDIADLRTVWIEAQVYEDEVSFLKEGQPVTATTNSIPDREFTGTLSFVHPHLDQATRTLKVRFDMDNPGHVLRPGMYVIVKLQVPVAHLPMFPQSLSDQWTHQTSAALLAQSLFAPAGPLAPVGLDGLLQAGLQNVLQRQNLVLAVPESSVIDTGSRKVVYREVSPGLFEGVQIKVGPRADQFYPVVGGLEPGDRVVTTGSFLIDAETRLNPAAGSIYFGGNSGTSKSESTATANSSSMAADKDDAVEAGRARLSPEDRRLVEAQDLCPILNENRLGAMGPPIKLMLLGQPVFLCCKGCVKEAQAQPDATLAKVAQFKAKAKDAAAHP